MEAQQIYNGVLQHYSAAARSDNLSSSHRIAQAFGYSLSDLDSAPEANLGLSCGNPLALASLSLVAVSSFRGHDPYTDRCRERRSSTSVAVLDLMCFWRRSKSDLLGGQSALT